MTLRPDLLSISNLIAESSRVLDIGCFEGELLSHLVHNKKVDGRGIELSQSNVSKCVKNGLAVIQGDASVDLKFYPDKCFDYVISSQMLQATYNPRDVLVEMLRIGKKVIISIPNFGYWYNRLYLLAKGRMPVSKTLSYQWYETPNIHFSTIKDFRELCQAINCNVREEIFLSPCGRIKICLAPNLLAETGVFLLGDS